MVRYHPDVKTNDLSRRNDRIRKRIRRAIEARLANASHQYGELLRKILKGYWKLRVGDCRVVLGIVNGEVWIFGIIHRKNIYEMIEERIP